MFSSLGIGIFTSTIARSSQQVMFLIWFILIFFLLLSGLFIPVENMPSWIQKVTWINPLRYFMLIVREMFLKGSGFRELWPDGLHLLVIGICMFGMALLAFKRKLG
jgi:ABC-2 type transport system permease protein